MCSARLASIRSRRDRGIYLKLRKGRRDVYGVFADIVADEGKKGEKEQGDATYS